MSKRRTTDPTTFTLGGLVFSSERIDRLAPKPRQMATRVLQADRALHKEREVHKEGGKLTAAGMAEALRPIIETRVVPEVRRVIAEVESLGAEIKSARETMRSIVTDKADVPAALLRWQAREELRRMSPGDRLGILLNGSEELYREAVLEAPDRMSGLEPGIRVRLEEKIIEARYPGKLAELAEVEEGLSAVEAIAHAVVMGVQADLGLAHKEAEFNKFMAEATAKVDAELAGERDKARRDAEARADADRLAALGPEQRKRQEESMADFRATMDKLFDDALSGAKTVGEIMAEAKPARKTMTRSEFESLSPGAKNSKMTEGVELVD